MQSISYNTEQKAICIEESMRCNMTRNTIQQYCIISSFTLPLFQRFARRTERPSRSRDAKDAIKNILQPYSLSNHWKQAYKWNYHYARLSHSLSSNSAIAQYSHSIQTAMNSSPLHPRTTLHPPSKQDVWSITTFIQWQIHAFTQC